jgi:Skp family chaperone for outer membrane proteins
MKAIKIFFPFLVFFAFGLFTSLYGQESASQRAVEMANKLNEQLGLRPEQKAKIEQILSASVAKIQQIRTERKNNPEIEKERGVIMQEIQNASKQIEAELDAEQKNKFTGYKKEFREELRRRRQERRRQSGK